MENVEEKGKEDPEATKNHPRKVKGHRSNAAVLKPTVHALKGSQMFQVKKLIQQGRARGKSNENYQGGGK